ncbi:MAG: YicC/YloC family endoribonuclease [Lentisphaeria bacterium]
MRSMTGYGRGTAEADGNLVSVELSAVNSRKQVEMRFAIPRELGMLEPPLRQQAQQKLSRGSLNIAVTYQLSQENNSQLSCIDLEAACRAVEMLREIGRRSGLQNEPSIADVLQIPGVLNTTGSLPYKPLQQLAETALGRALEGLDAMRLKEGQVLQQDLQQRGQVMSGLVERIVARRDEAVQQQKLRLQERIAKLGLELSLDDERLAKELVFYAERADITEETVRLQSHLVQYQDLLNSPDDPGRNLDFLGQEMNREVSTLAAKTADQEISALALSLKTELGRIREQIMNIE